MTEHAGAASAASDVHGDQEPSGTDEGTDEGTEEAGEAEPFRATEEGEAAMDAIVRALPAEAQLAMVDRVVRDLALSDDLVADLAEASGLPEETFHEAHRGFEVAIQARTGIADMVAFEAWVMGDAGRMQEAQAAIAGLLRSNQVAGFDRLALAFMEAQMRG